MLGSPFTAVLILRCFAVVMGTSIELRQVDEFYNELQDITQHLKIYHLSLQILSGRQVLAMTIR